MRPGTGGEGSPRRKVAGKVRGGPELFFFFFFKVCERTRDEAAAAGVSGGAGCPWPGPG